MLETMKEKPVGKSGRKFTQPLPVEIMKELKSWNKFLLWKEPH